MALILSTDSRNKIAELADSEQRSETRKTKSRLAWGLGGFAAAVVLGALVAPTGLGAVAVIASYVVGVIGSAHAAGHFINEKTLGKVKAEANEEGFAEKHAKRKSFFNKVFRRSDKISDRSMWGALGCFAVAMLAPPVAPIAWAAYNASLITMGTTALASIVTKYASRSADRVADTTLLLAAQDTLKASIQPSNENKPNAPGLSNAPAPGNDFSKAVNGPDNTAPAEAPVKAPPPPKP
jgi:hypothetical protein